jgi:hypothetical protein
MTDLALLPLEERQELFRRAADTGSGPRDPVMIEKDYWVCWTLERLFGTGGADELVARMVFKGGTSLSKVYGAINRFSEDIDLTIPRDVVGIDAGDEITPTLSATRARRKLDVMTERCHDYVVGPLKGAIYEGIAKGLSAAEHDRAWSLEVATEDPATLVYAYPSALEAGEYGAGGYVAPVVRLEFGIRNETWPAREGDVLHTAALLQ